MQYNHVFVHRVRLLSKFNESFFEVCGFVFEAIENLVHVFIKLVGEDRSKDLLQAVDHLVAT